MLLVASSTSSLLFVFFFFFETLCLINIVFDFPKQTKPSARRNRHPNDL